MEQGDRGTYAENYGEEFQLHLLAVAARHPGFIVRFRTALNHQFFSNSVHRAVAKTLLAHVDEHSALPTAVTLFEEVKVGLDDTQVDATKKVIRRIYKRDIKDAEAVSLKAADFGQTQALANAVMECVDFINDGETDKILERVQQALLVGQDILDVGIHFNTVNRAEVYSDDDVETMPTGIQHVDHVMRGGLGRGELGVILAPPGRGKTTFLINLGYGAALAGRNVVHYSLEMRKKKIAIRYDDRLSGSALKYKHTDPEKYQRLLDKRAEKLLRGHLYIQSYPTRSMGVSTIRSHLSILASQGFLPDVMLVDYGDIMKPERRKGEMRHEQAGIYEDLRTLAGEFNIAVWTASQTSRSSLSKEVITIEDFAESFEKAAIADAAIGFCQTDSEVMERRMRLFLAKLRGVEDGGMIDCTIDRAHAEIKSDALFDSSTRRVWTDADDPDDRAADVEVETVRHVHGKVDKSEQSPIVKKRARKQVKKAVKKGKTKWKPNGKPRGKSKAQISKRVPEAVDEE